MAGTILDLTGSFPEAFLNGMAWNLLNLSIAPLAPSLTFIPSTRRWREPARAMATRRSTPASPRRRAMRQHCTSNQCRQPGAFRQFIQRAAVVLLANTPWLNQSALVIQKSATPSRIPPDVPISGIRGDCRNGDSNVTTRSASHCRAAQSSDEAYQSSGRLNRDSTRNWAHR